MTEKTGYKYVIGFDQSMSNGMLKFSGNAYFDAPEEFEKVKEKLVTMLKDTEQAFKDANYRVASEIPNNMEKFATKNAQAKLGAEVKDKVTKKESGK